MKNAPSEDSDQTAPRRRQVLIFAGCIYPTVCFLTLQLNIFCSIVKYERTFKGHLVKYERTFKGHLIKYERTLRGHLISTRGHLKVT